MRRALARLIRRYLSEREGAAAVEFAIWVTLLTVPILNVIDVGFYAYNRMQLETAAQMGAQAIWKTCDLSTEQPVTAAGNCSSYSTVATAAAQSTSLGTGVTLGTITEGWYCANSSGVLTKLTSPALTGTRPTSCTAGVSPSGLASGYPGDYVNFTASYTYSPLFSAVSITSLLPATMSKEVWIRVS